MSKDAYRLTGAAANSGKIFLGLGILGAIGCAISYGQDHKHFFFSYLTSFVFFISISLGALFFVMVHHLARASWSVTVRRIAENLAANLPWMALLLLPLLAGIPDLFHWSHHDAVALDPVLQSKEAYLNIPFFLVRLVLFFGLWTWLSRYFLSRSVRQDTTGDPHLSNTMAKWSALGLIGYGLTETFFAFDWLMSLDPHWFSTIFGVYFFAASVVALYCSLIIIAFVLRASGHLKDMINLEHFHDMGKLLFGFNVFWTYIAFSQFMLIWYTNLPEETVFFQHRAEGSWKIVSLILPWGHFAIPFLFLMSRNIKRRLPLLFIGAVWLLIMCFIDIYWLVMPNLHHHGVHFGLADISSVLAIGGIFVFLLIGRMKKSALIPIKDPRLAQCLNYNNG